MYGMIWWQYDGLLRRNLVLKWSVENSNRVFETGFKISKMNQEVINNDQL